MPTYSYIIPNSPGNRKTYIPIQTSIDSDGVFQYVENDEFGNLQTYYTQYQYMNSGGGGATGPQGFQGTTGPTGSQGIQGVQGVQGFQGPTGGYGLTYSGSTYAIALWNTPTSLIYSFIAYDSSSIYSVDFSNRFLYDPSSVISIVYGSRLLYPTSGSFGDALTWGNGINPSLPSDIVPLSYLESHGGLTSATGPTGSQGTQGVQGFQGTQGVQGFQGITGPTGSQGTQGVQGFQGTQGVQGFQGTQGVQGFQGTQGVQGFQGTQGVQGFQGTQGVQGFQGTQGVQGFQGTQGVQGFQGTQGVQGFQGTQGVQGFQGTTGPTGSQGTQGVQGFQGTQGVQGFQGTTGPTGSQGTQGVQGFQGTQGVQGFQGTQGVQGFQGTQGVQGFQGTQGVQGFQGTTGPTGSQGTQGVQGFQGTQGVQGFQGTQGVQGFQGTQGVQGFQGTQGTFATGNIGNGLTYSSSQIQMGGTLSVATTINQEGLNFTWLNQNNTGIGTFTILATSSQDTSEFTLNSLSGINMTATSSALLESEVSIIPNHILLQTFDKNNNGGSVETFTTSVVLSTENSTGSQSTIQLYNFDQTSPGDGSNYTMIITDTINQKGLMYAGNYESNFTTYSLVDMGWVKAHAATGATGSQGTQGPQGTIGPQGVQGFQGFQGTQGVQGFQGFQGTQGVQGTTGPNGLGVTYSSTGLHIANSNIIFAGGSGAGSYLIPANSMALGTSYRICAAGTCSSSTSQTQDFRLYIGPNGTTSDTEVYGIGISSFAGNMSFSVPFFLEFNITMSAIGTSANPIVSLSIISGSASQGILNGQVAIAEVQAVSTTFNSKVANYISAAYKSGAATTACNFFYGRLELVKS